MVDGSIGDRARMPLVLVPGLLCDERLWQPQAERLADLADPVIADVIVDLAEKGSFEEVPRRLRPGVLHPDRLDDARLTSIVFGMVDAVGPEAFVHQEEAIIGRPDSRGTLAGIACPTLVLCGREDALTPLPLHEEMTFLIPDSRLRVIEKCSHLSTLERPEAVTAALREWLETAGNDGAAPGA